MATSDAPLSVPNVTLAVARNANSGGNPSSGGTAALSWSAPNGLADKQTVTIETDGTYDFGSGPTKFVTIGFGEGWLHDNPLGTEMPAVITDPISGEQIDYEFGGKVQDEIRKVDEDSTGRFMSAPKTITQAMFDAGENSHGQGSIIWNLGSYVPESTYIFLSSWVRHIIEGEVHTPDRLQSTQYKTYRFWDGEWPNSGNGVWQKPFFPEKTNLGTVSVSNGSTAVAGSGTRWSELFVDRIQINGDGVWRTCSRSSDTSITLAEPYDGATVSGVTHVALRGGQTKHIFDNGPSMSNGARHWPTGDWTRQDSLLKTNNFGQANGIAQDRVISTATGGLTEGFPDADAGIDTGDGTATFYSNVSAPRIERVIEQGYINKTIAELDMHYRDFFYQIGTGARFELADAATPQTATTSHILPPASWASGTSVTCKLWKGMISSYESAFIHAYGHEGQFLGAVELGGQN